MARRGNDNAGRENPAPDDQKKRRLHAAIVSFLMPFSGFT
ncbi:hypothetical protein HMPREF1147_1807 [Selenomonas sp. FOBRC9]|nr:hypothetical protein HMPREF1147_1807 [Selenomonas sp. FOBRC9]